MGCHFLLQGIFPTQGLNPGLPHCRQTLYHLSHQGSPFHVWLLRNKEKKKKKTWLLELASLATLHDTKLISKISFCCKWKFLPEMILILPLHLSEPYFCLGCHRQLYLFPHWEAKRIGLPPAPAPTSRPLSGYHTLPQLVTDRASSLGLSF